MIPAFLSAALGLYGLLIALLSGMAAYDYAHTRERADADSAAVGAVVAALVFGAAWRVLG